MISPASFGPTRAPLGEIAIKLDDGFFPQGPTGGPARITGGKRHRVAIVGSGVAGLGAAAALNDCCQVTLFEAEDRPGGHAMTIPVDYDGVEVAADVGFMVFAPAIYPQLCDLFSKLGVKSRRTSMSFGVSAEDGFDWSWTGKRDPRGWLRNGLSTERRRLFLEILRFNSFAKRIARDEPTSTTPLKAWFSEAGLSPTFARLYGFPLVCAIWSVPAHAAAEFPVGRLCVFLERHRLLYLQAHSWRSIIGGSARYVEPLVSTINDVRVATPVERVERRADGGVIVRDAAGREELFDTVIFGTHPDDTLRILADADGMERGTLGAISYQPNEVVLHRDPALMPPKRALWAAWNVCLSRDQSGGEQSSVSYWLNRLQGVPKAMPLFVTVNPQKEPATRTTFGRWTLSHFELNGAAVAAQSALPAIQGRGGVWHCGAWTADGFHEDGLASGLAVGAQIAAQPVKQALEGSA